MRVLGFMEIETTENGGVFNSEPMRDIFYF